MTTPSANNTVIGRCKLFLDRHDAAGLKTGMLSLGNCNKIGIGQTPTTTEMRNFMEDTTVPYEKRTTGNDIKLNVGMFEYDIRNLALHSLGDIDTVTQNNTPVTDEVLADDTLTDLKGKYFMTVGKNISSVVVEQGSNTLVAGTDYVIEDAKAGLIRLLPTSATIVDGTDVLVSYAKPAQTAKRILGGTTPNIYGTLTAITQNKKGPNYIYKFHRVQIIPNGELDLVSEDFQPFSIDVTCLEDLTGLYGGSVTNPYYEVLEKK